MSFHFRSYEFRWDLGIIFDVFILVWSNEQKQSQLENVSVLIFRLAWKTQKMKPEIRNSTVCENIRPEVLFA